MTTIFQGDQMSISSEETTKKKQDELTPEQKLAIQNYLFTWIRNGLLFISTLLTVLGIFGFFSIKKKKYLFDL